MHVSHSFLKAHWGPSCISLLASAADIYNNFESFLETLVEWIIKCKQNSAHGGTEIMAIQKAQDVWVGVGVYSSSEILYATGALILPCKYSYFFTMHL